MGLASRQRHMPVIGKDGVERCFVLQFGFAQAGPVLGDADFDRPIDETEWGMVPRVNAITGNFSTNDDSRLQRGGRRLYPARW